jgi:hypothetical protein
MSAFHHPLLAAIEGFLFFLVLIGISAISNWIQRQQERQKGGRAPDATKPPRRSLPDEETDWEAELRRLLEGGPPEEPEPPPPPPPPPVRPATPPPLPASPQRAEVKRFSPPSAPGQPEVVEQAARLDEAVSASERELRADLATLEVSKEAYERASHLDQSVAKRLREVRELTRQARATLRRVTPKTCQAGVLPRVRAALRHPASAREAVVLAEILGPPKGLQDLPR